MKKFSKILTLILALVVIVTAFTVVALAAEPSYTNQKGHKEDATFESESFTVGSRPFNRTGGAPTNGGIFIGEAYPGGNKYLELQTSTGNAGETRYTTWVGTEYSRRTKYTFANYPTIAIEFDIMSPTGQYGLYDATNATNSAAYYVRPYVGATLESTGRFNQVRFGQLGLSTTPYDWQHVTVVYEYYVAPVVINEETQETEDHEFLKQSAYVNGVLTKEWTVIDHTAQGITNSKQYFVGPLYFQSGRYFGSTQKIAIDNIQFVYYEEGYDKSKIPTTIYNDTWEAPFGQLLATVTVGEGEEAVVNYFDNIDKACEFANANPGSKLTLVADITANYTVDSAFSIDANIYDENGVPTGVYTGIDTYARTTVGYYMKETAEGSGIYEATKGDFMVSQSDGSYIAYPESEFTARIFKANSTTLKLLNDIEVDAVFTVNKTNYTIDLNGYALKRISYYGNVYNYDEAAGDYVKADTGISSKGATMFTLNSATGAHSYGFLITSSNGQGAIYNINYSADHYYNDGVLVKRDNLANQRTTLIYTTASYSSTTNKFTFENFDHYGGMILNVDYNGRKNLNFYFDNIRHYQMNSYASNNAQHAFYLSANVGFNLQVTNSLFYFNDHATNMTSGLIRLVAALTDGYTTDVKFTNCDIIANNDGADEVGIMNSQSGEDIQLIDCRIYNFDTTTATLRTSQGTIVNYKENRVPAALDGWSNKALAQNITKTYTVPNVYNWAITDGEIQSVNTDIETKEYVCTFDRICTKEVDVMIGDKTVSLIPGVSDIYADKANRVYADTETDALLNTVYLLKDANGNVYDKYLGLVDGEFKFDWNTTELTASTEIVSVGGIKDINFNLGFLSGFRYNFYVPAYDARLTDVVVEGFEKSENTVLIDGFEYYVYSKLVGTAAAADANVISATFKVDGIDYSQTWSINAVQYAQMLIADPLYDSEKTALVNMIKFIKEAVLCTPESTADVTALEAIVTGAGAELTYGTYTEGNVECLNPFGGDITGANFLVYNGVAAYKFTLAAEDTEISFSLRGEEIGFTRDGNAVILDAMRLYDLIDPIDVTANGVTSQVSMLDYLTAMEGSDGMELAKAVYEFGLAADAYKADLMANN